ncbi:CPBP family intramembrane glutamic endopeptidase [Corallococcus carmarthensis]|uniref:CPBP family intramembrane metalloprotease n=1 Tax=Corallococcus carmarthensis TaxID=2316728 RepID=A0A3A8KIP5_9BACT|nr:type II CAAX endopeptidase family protein [Corallococcus carmarthensis]NOK16467.1 CPBP family intramembrane metalloprotease [Corallococcus carmarthensis]RKH07227.1 CPBP family intramembrane metalloprotease [Corallococcus carmarthensis]
MKAVFRDGEGHLRNGWKGLGFFVVAAILAGILMWLQTLLPDAVRPFAPNPFFAFLGVLLVSLDFLYLERQPLTSLGMSLDRRAGRDLGAGALGGVVLVGLVALGVWAAGGVHLERAANAHVTAVVRTGWLMLGVALFEEALFHGYIFQRAIRGMGTVWAQVVISLIFCLAHPFSTEMEVPTRVVAMITTFMAGWMLGLCYLRTRHLALPVGVHLGWNWFLGVMGFGVSGKEFRGWWMPVFHGRPEWLTGGSYGLEASIFAVVALGVAIIALTRWKGSAAREPEAMPRPDEAPALNG